MNFKRTKEETHYDSVMQSFDISVDNCLLELKMRSTSFRYLMVSSQEGVMPEVLGMIHVHRKTPLPAALALVTELTIILYKRHNYLKHITKFFLYN